MRNHKATILTAFPISLIILIIAVLFEFQLIDIPHSSFYQNITLGIFASAILIVMTSVVSYKCEKTTYCKEQFSDISEMIVYAKTLLKAMKQKDPDLKSHLFFEQIELRFNNVKIRMWNFACFRYNHKDIVIESSMALIIKILQLQNLLSEQSIQYKKGKINTDTHTWCYDTITNQLVKDYYSPLIECEKKVQSIIKSLIKDRKLHSIFLDEDK